MKKLIATTIVMFVMIFSSTPALAYGGGGLPPWNPHPPVKIICELVSIHLPFGHVIKIPWCHVEGRSSSDNDFSQRLHDFIERVLHGHA